MLCDIILTALVINIDFYRSKGGSFVAFCTNCGNKLNEDDVFCTKCGRRVGEPPDTEYVEGELLTNDTTEPWDTVALDDENGNQVLFQYLDRFRYRGKEYVFLVPEDEPIDDAEVVILEVVVKYGDENFVSIDDTRVMNEVFAEFRRRHSEDYNFK